MRTRHALRGLVAGCALLATSTGCGPAEADLVAGDPAPTLDGTRVTPTPTDPPTTLAPPPEPAATPELPGSHSTAFVLSPGDPYAWINGPYVARVGSTLTLDGSGSYAADGSPLSYAWDFDQDGRYDQTTRQPLVERRFDQPFNGLLTLRVTDRGGRTAIATTHLGITDDGDETPRERDNCPDVANHGQGDYDGDGIGDACDPDGGYPTEDVNDVVEIMPTPGG